MKKFLWSLVSITSLVSLNAMASEPKTFVVEPQNIEMKVTLDGTVEAKNRSTLAAQTSGRVVSIFVDVNDFVAAGDTILEISAKQQTAATAAAEAQLNSAIAQDREAQSNLQRYKTLFPKGAISQQEMDSAVARARSTNAAVKSATATLQQSKESLGYTSIEAPYAGVVTRRMVEVGETVSPGTPLMEGLSLEQLRVTTEIPQRYLDLISGVEQFSVVTHNDQRIYPIDLNLFSYANTQSHTFTMRLDLPSNTQNIYPGMWVKTEFVYGEREALTVPVSAVLKRGELSAVYRMVDGVRKMNPVRLGQLSEGYYEILSGLEVGDVVATQAVVFGGKSNE